MLNYIQIHHFAIIDNTKVELSQGLTALTGETGAGKSILLDALGLATGARASADNIQQGADKAEVNAAFDIQHSPKVQQWLVDQELNDHNDCILRRVIARSGKSRATINDRPVSLSTLRALGEQLISIHGQNEHQLLTKTAAQRELLDLFAKNPLLPAVTAAFNEWQKAHKRLLSITEQAQAHQYRLDLLQFQLQEFDALDTGGNAISDIEAEHRWLANADRLIQLSEKSLQHLDDDGASSALAQGISTLSELVNIDPRLQEALDLIDSAYIQCNEATRLLRNHASSFEHDTNRLQWLDERLAVLHRLAKKHRVSINELDSVEATLRAEYDQMTAPDLQVDTLNKQVEELRSHYNEQASKLSKARLQAAKTLAQHITNSMQILAMQGGVFTIDIKTDQQLISAHGQDNVTFCVSPNPGVAPAPLSKTASGGELSRISLAIQLAVMDTQSVQTLIFDEVDTGIGGAVAENVGKLLRTVAKHTQVLCVTHLPQVAVQAHHHLLVTKKVENEKTQTWLDTLNKKQTLEEIARMLGGSTITKKSRLHAKEMLENVSD